MMAYAARCEVPKPTLGALSCAEHACLPMSERKWNPSSPECIETPLAPPTDEPPWSDRRGEFFGFLERCVVGMVGDEISRCVGCGLRWIGAGASDAS